MCGIFGVNNKENINFINKIITNHFHRGPDQNNFFQNDKVTLVHNRLSILDIDKGIQPMSYENLVIIYNGEIFNSRELKKNLENEGYIFETQNSDTEVLLKLYHFKKEKMLNDLNGMFSFVIYDKSEEIFFGAVDSFSIKPMYYSFKNNKFVFSSEIKSILDLNHISKNINHDSAINYFQLQYIPFEETIYTDIKKLSNSKYFIFELKKKKLQIFDYKRESCRYVFNNYRDIVNLGKKLLNQSVIDWSLSDVPVACSLSGGLDSSLISSIFANHSNKKIKTITVGFDNKDNLYDERYYAKKVSDFIKSDHQEVIVQESQVLNDLDIIFDNLLEPYGGSLASWYVYKNLKNEKVILTGTGADEIFGNYGKWKNYFLSDFFLKNFYDNFFKQNIKNSKFYYGYFYKKIYYEKEIYKLFISNQTVAKNINFKINSLKRSNFYSPKKIIQEIDLNLQLPWEFLYITDRLSMLNSIEARTPFLDHKIIDFINSVPSKFMGNFLNSKKLLKDISKSIIPDEIINRKKRGFVLPKENWLKNELKTRLYKYSSKKFLDKQGIFNHSYINKLLKFFFKKNNNILTEKIWTFFIFQLWYEKNDYTS